MQKLFRILALFCFFALILSPLYFKYIKHYLQSIKLEKLVVEDITNSFTLGSKFCTLDVNTDIQVLHFFSLTCPSCTKELSYWHNFQSQAANIKIQHIITKSSLAFPDSKTTLSQLLSSNNNACLAVIDESMIDKINLGSLPHTLIVKNGVIIFSIGGRVDQSDLSKISEMLQKYHD